MTISELKASDKEFLTVTETAHIMHCAPSALAMAARQKPERLGFPIIVVGKRIRIPRRAFLRYIEGEYGNT